ncbi:MAG TPA: efflux RND transporter permease subunit [Luteibacter sp.]|uniref:efflux RND transporter permease subunit n=1 Tax=Luteibacter sp. TaxID=1886636 RepID=UPI002BEDE50B|nr:efflux RND transporter permease subunit [Luteibacter sp.]HVI56050.1 efflux RND transporter permease subunit [Luteibacter sp.]
MLLTRSALDASRLTLFIAALILIAGTWTFLHFPSQEEPSVTVRDAVVSISLPGMATDEVENILAKPAEERLRELGGLKTIATTIRPGSVVIQLTAYDSVTDLDAMWLKVRSKLTEVAQTYPQGTIGPFLDDDFGRVSVASIAITAPGVSLAQMREPIKRFRSDLYALKGVERVVFYGLQDTQLYLQFDKNKLLSLGLTPGAVAQQLAAQNAIASAGQPSVSGLGVSVSVEGKIRSVDDLRGFLLSVPRGDQTQDITLGEVATIQAMPTDPPQSAAVYQGQQAVVVSVSMAEGLDIAAFGNELKARIAEASHRLPTGFDAHVVTFQADVVAREMGKMHHVMGETIVIVMAVVMLFLGWRMGLVVGSIVPLTILSSLIIMRAFNIELQMVSMAAIILALGLLVDNGIVIAEDIERRLKAGEKRRQACIDAGRTLAVPLLVSTLVIVFAFSPFFLGQTSTNEYLRSLAVVLAVTLLGSWVLGLTVTPLLCFYFAKVHADAVDSAEHESRFYHGYRRVIGWVLTHKVVFVGVMLALLGGAGWALSRLPYDFLPKSDRLQFQIPLTFQAGTDSRQTLASVRQISKWLADTKINPEVENSVGYVADGGPRVVLGLNPPLPGANIGYFTVSVVPDTDLDAVIARTRTYLANAFPNLHAEPKRFSLGATEAGVAVYRVSGVDESTLRTLSAQLETVLRALPGTVDTIDSWGPRVPRYRVTLDQRKLHANGITREDVQRALQVRYSGYQAAAIDDGGATVPIVLRGSPLERTSDADPGDTLIYPAAASTAPVALNAVATVALDSEPGVVQRRNLSRSITVTARNPNMTAQQMADQLAPAITRINPPPGYAITLGGEIEDSAEANAVIAQYMPLAIGGMLLLFVWQFNSFRKVFIIVASVPFILIGSTLALVVTGYPFGFMATFGLLALAGIIVNNAVLLLERIEAELAEGRRHHEAVIEAAVKRLRPIVMTKLTCIVGLIPLMLFAGPLWTGMAITLIGGLLLGTLVTLGLIPLLYDTLFREKDAEPLHGSAAPRLGSPHGPPSPDA